MAENSNVIDNLRLKVEADARSANSDIDKLIGDLGRLATAVDALNGKNLKGIFSGSGIKAFADQLDRLDSSKVAELTREFTQLSSVLSSLHFPRVGNIGTVVTPESTESLRAFSEEVNRFDLAKLQQMASVDLGNIGRMRSVDYSGALSHISEQLGQLTHAFERLNPQTSESANRIHEVGKAAQTTSSSMRSISKSAHTTGNAFSKAASKVGNFVRSIGRIAFYRMIRSAIKAVTQGLAEGTEQMYYWAQLSGNVVAQSLDRIAASADYLKRGFASMFSPLINAAAPVIEYLTDRIVDFFNLVQRAFAALTGADHWTKALRVPKKFKEDTDAAGKSAKALQNILMGFDELNVINTPNQGGGKSGKEAEDYSGLFETLYEDIGEIDWAGLGKKIGKGLGKIGEKIAEVFTWDWGKIGKKIGGFVSGIIEGLAEEIETQDWGEAAANFGQAVSDLITGANDNNQLTNAIKRLLKSVFNQVPGLALGVAEGSTTIASAILKLFGLDSVAKWIEDHITKPIREARETIQKEANGNVWNYLFPEGYGKAWKEATTVTEETRAKRLHPNQRQMDSTYDWFTGLFNGGNKDGNPTKKQKDSITEWASQVWKEAQDFFDKHGIKPSFAGTILGWVQEKWKPVKSWIDTNPINPKVLIPNLRDQVKEKWDEFTAWWATKKEELKLVYPNIKQKVQEKWTNFTSWWSNVHENIKLVAPNIISKVQEKWKLFERWWKSVKEDIKLGAPNIKALVKEKWDAFTEWWKDKIAAIKISFPNLIEGMQQKWNELVSWWQNLSLPTISGKVGFVGGGAGRAFASGGFPERGEIFVANEAGPELIGSLSGRPAVASNNEITGISTAIREQGALDRQMMREFMSLVKNKNLTISPSAALGQVVAKSGRMWAGVTG